jgi:hypothetical protein
MLNGTMMIGVKIKTGYNLWHTKTNIIFAITKTISYENLHSRT